MLIDNTLLLRDRFPEIRKYFREYEQDLQSDRISVIESKSGFKTLQYFTDDNKKVMVHSKYDPLREAERIISSHKEKINIDTHIFFYGIGMGYHIEKFRELFPNNTYSMYEPVPEIFLEVTKKKLIDNIITSKARNLYIDNHATQSENYLQEFSSNNRNVHVIVLPSYENIAKEKSTGFRKNIKKTILNRRSNLHTNFNFQKRWVINSLMNFGSVLNTPNIIKDIDHKQFIGKPALIVSAGPSLAEDMEYIKHIEKNNLAYIFSVGSAINSLIEYEVLPDAVCTYDPGEKNHLVFKKMIDNKIDHIPMVFGTSVGYEILNKYNGPKTHFITSQDKTSLYFLQDKLDLKNDLILDAPSIAVMTFQVLNKLGADPIIFAGQNLGYLYDRLYSEGIDYEHIPSTVDQKKLNNAITTIDVYGNEIKTNIGFNNMRENIELYADFYKSKTFINTTKGGAAIEGVQFQLIEEVIEKILTHPIEKENWFNSANSYNLDNFKEQHRKLQKSIDSFYKLLESFEHVLSYIARYSNSDKKVLLEKSLIQFDELYNSLNSNDYYKYFLSFYIRVQVEIMGNEIRRLNKESNSIVKGKEIEVLLSNFLKQCKLGHSELYPIINECLKELSMIN
ncbi:Uncharacterized conserved protein [Oceanobacillus limi]|uniref:Uncharacterized conserved protein n=1 Tax=Oceanobacillus limi TaxID=930131 RepID=A0A1I0BKP0_9BACI|nr:6-hydroxymethylpterin diphosphokinase MptE-like protein [Oceanobacillus limi]SET07516.1 Uncharacterized conserved protein [Oceanobacillus limi]